MKWISLGAAFVVAGCIGTPGDMETRPEVEQHAVALESDALPGVGPVGAQPGAPAAAIPGTRGLVIAHLQQLWQPGAEARQSQTLKALAARPDAVEELTKMYDEEVSASVDTTQRVARAQARWTLVFVLGNLKDKKATAVLERIVATPLPDPAVEDGEVFAGEYRIRLRAIDGLRDVGAVDTLEQIHAQGRLLSGAAGVALFELGRAPKGVAPVDLRHLMSQADPTDVNPKQNPQPTMQIPQR